MTISYKNRLEIAFLALHPKGPKMGIHAISKYMKCPTSTVERWVQRYHTTGDVQIEVKAPRTRATTSKQDKMIIDSVEEHSEESMPKIFERLKKKGLSCQIDTVRNRIKEAGIMHLAPLKKPMLTEEHRANRLQWAEDHKDFDWDRVIFTDESTYTVYMPVTKVWRRRGEKKVVRTLKHPCKINFWGCLSSKGFGCCYSFKPNLNADLMCGIYEKRLLPTASYWFGGDPSSWYLQEDNDPKHTSIKCSTWRAENKVQRLSWPSNSPDLNPIENVWSFMKSQIRGKSFRSADALERKIKNIWQNLSPEYAKKLVNSMSSRLDDVASNEGDWILY